MVFDGAHHHRPGGGTHRTEHGEVRRLGTATGEDDVAGGCAEELRHRVPGLVDDLASRPGDAVVAGRVTEETGKPRGHGGDGVRGQGRRGGMVQVCRCALQRAALRRRAPGQAQTPPAAPKPAVAAVVVVTRAGAAPVVATGAEAAVVVVSAVVPAGPRAADPVVVVVGTVVGAEVVVVAGAVVVTGSAVVVTGSVVVGAAVVAVGAVVTAAPVVGVATPAAAVEGGPVVVVGR